MARKKENESIEENVNTEVEGVTDELAEIARKEKELTTLKKRAAYNFKKDESKIHSLYKLNAANFKKNTSYTSTPKWEEVEHCHFFHTISSAGTPQTECAPVGGHFHILEVVKPATDNEPAVYKCSGPKRRVRQKDAEGNWVVVIAPANGVDNHTHEVEYKHSEIWSPPQMNEEFVKYQSILAGKLAKQNSEKFVEQ